MVNGNTSPEEILTQLLEKTKGYSASGDQFSTSPAIAGDSYQLLVTQVSVNRLIDKISGRIEPSILKETGLLDALNNGFESAKLENAVTLDSGDYTRKAVTVDNLTSHIKSWLDKTLTPQQCENIQKALGQRMEQLEQKPQDQVHPLEASLLKANVLAVHNADKDRNNKITVGEILQSLAEQKVLVADSGKAPAASYARSEFRNERGGQSLA